MPMNERVTESEATLLAGVSLKTLERFAETGYLVVNTGENGNKLYFKNEVEQVFGIKASEPSSDRSTPDNIKTDDIKTELSTKKATEDSTISSQNESSQRTEIKLSENLTTEKNTAINSSTVKETVPQTASNNNNLHSETIQQETQSITVKDQEIFRLQKINEVNEKIIEIREQQYVEIQKERDWLRAQVDKLEIKRDRDQLLLLSETQTLRKMIEHQLNPKRSPLKNAIEWLGEATGMKPAPTVRQHTQNKPIQDSVIETEVID